MSQSRGATGYVSSAVAVLASALLLCLGFAVPQASATAEATPCWDDVATDYDGGGPDVVVGLPSFDVKGKEDAGAIAIYSNVAELGDVGPRSPQGRALLTADDFPGLSSLAGARFGASVAGWSDAGDFDDPDHCSDLLVGAPGQAVDGKAGAGAVYRLTGTEDGLHGVGDVITEASLGGVGGAQAGAGFGAEIATETLLLLAIGAPGRDVGAAANAGRVVSIPFYGYPVPDPAVVIEQGGLAGGTAESGDRFGQVIELMESGDGPFMVVGVPKEDVGGHRNAGLVTMLPPHGTPSSVHQDSPGTGGSVEAGDQYGSALAVSWTVNDAADPVGVVTVGVPGENVGAVVNAGMVSWTQFTLTDTTGEDWVSTPLSGMAHFTTQASPGVAGSVERGDAFGTAVLVGEAGSDSGRSYLLVGSPNEDLGSVRDAGIVTSTPIDRFGRYEPAKGSPRSWTQNSPGAPGQAEAGDRFGSALSLILLTNYEDDDDSIWPQLLVTVPGEDVAGVRNAGLAQLGTPPGADAVSLRPLKLQRAAGAGMVPLRTG